MFWVTSPDLHLVDMEWASSMVITLAGLEPKQKLLRLMNWSFGCILWPRPTSTWWTWGGPPPWVSPWWSWNQNKSCLDWWTDRFDVFFDRVQPQPGGHGVGLLHDYHPGGVEIKTKVAQFDELIILTYFLTTSDLHPVDLGFWLQVLNWFRC